MEHSKLRQTAMDARTQRIRQIGHATRFKPGNRLSPGRPATAKFSKACKQLMREYGTGYAAKSEELVRHCLRRALNGSARHAELIIRYAGPKLWQELQEVVQETIKDPETNWLLRRKAPKRRVPGPALSGSKRLEDSLKTQFSNTQGVPPQIQAIPPHIGVEEEQQALAPAKRPLIKVERW